MDIGRKLLMSFESCFYEVFCWRHIFMPGTKMYNFTTKYNIHQTLSWKKMFTFPTMLNHTSYLVGASTLLLQHPSHTHSINVNTTLSTMCLSKFNVVHWVLLFIFCWGEKKLFPFTVGFWIYFFYFFLSLAISWFKVRKLEETFVIK